MNLSFNNSSPKFRNLINKTKQSPVEIKEKMRKNYKNKVQNCRAMLLDKFRESYNEKDLTTTLEELYRSVISYSEETDDIEGRFREEFKDELIQEELEWWLKEYETSQMENFDWSSMEEEDGVIICPVCQKNNFKIECNIVSCSYCNISIRTPMPVYEIKKSILDSVQKHSMFCSKKIQFSVFSELDENHMYVLCDSCNEMKSVI